MREGEILYIYAFRRLPSLFLPSPPPAAAPLPHAGEAPLSVMPLHGMTAPPQGEPSVPASIPAKFMVRQSRKKVHLTTKFSSVHGRALDSPCGRAGAKRLRGDQKEKRLLTAGALFIVSTFCNFTRKKAAVPNGTAA